MSCVHNMKQLTLDPQLLCPFCSSKKIRPSKWWAPNWILTLHTLWVHTLWTLNFKLKTQNPTLLFCFGYTAPSFTYTYTSQCACDVRFVWNLLSLLNCMLWIVHATLILKPSNWNAGCLLFRLKQKYFQWFLNIYIYIYIY